MNPASQLLDGIQTKSTGIADKNKLDIRSNSYRLFCVLILLVAGIGKMFELWNGASSSIVAIMFGASAELAFLTFELILAVALALSTRVVYVVIAILFFFCGIVFQVGLLWMGQITCGCFGIIDIHPIWVLFLDLICLSLLINAAIIQSRSGISFREIVSLFALFLFVFFICSGILPQDWVAKWRGESIVTPAFAINAGNGLVGTSTILEIELRNTSDHAVTILGSNSSCSCRLLGSEQLVIPSNQQMKILVELQYGRKTGLLMRTFDLLTNDPVQCIVRVRYYAYVLSDEMVAEFRDSLIRQRPVSVSLICVD